MTTVQPQKAGYGAAGRRGEGVRADLWVGVELREQGGVELALESRVAAYYGDSIRQQVYDLLLTLGVSDARVELQDHGALPFVIAARIEAAVLRAGVTPAADARPAARKPSGVGFVRSCLRRSRLYLPGNQPQYFVNAGLHRSDAVILDLEDSVHLAEKDAARLLVRNALRVVDFRNAERMVRINQLPLGLADLEAIVPEKPEVIVIPKTETADQVRGVAEIVDRLLGASATLRLIPILETALGVENCFEIATSSDRIAALTIGLEDYAADLGVARSTDGVESDFARRRLVNAAKAAGVQALDSVYADFDDLSGLQSWAENSRRLGFEGLGCLHPRQIEPVNAAFTPTTTEISRAQRIVEAFEAAMAEGLGVVSLGSKMIDPPVVSQAEKIVQRAAELGLLPTSAASAEKREPTP